MMSVALAPTPGFAQDAPPTQTTAPAEAPAPNRLQAAIEVGVTYSDNIFVTRGDEIGDVIYTVRPSISYAVGERDRRFVVRAQGELGRYADYTSEDYNDWLIGAEARYALSPATTLLGGGDYQWRHESRSSPDAERGLEPTEYEQSYLFGGLLLQRGAFSTRIAATVTGYDFSDVPATGGIFNNDDRDRTQTELGGRLSYRVRPGSDVFIQGALDRRDYDTPVDDLGFARDSDGLSVGLGFRRALSRGFTAEAFAGVMSQDYEDPRLGRINTYDMGALVDWTGPAGLGLNFRLDRSIGETTLAGAAAYVLTSGGLNLTVTPNPRLQVGTGINAARYDYVGAPRTETSAGLRSWVRYWIDPRIFIGAEHSLNQRTSSAAGFDYDENRFMVQLGARLQPRQLSGGHPFVLGQSAPGGPYLGAMLSYGTLSTGLDGPRGPGSNTADFAGMGPSYGVVAGYGWISGPVYLGLEAEAFANGPEWRHVADRVFSVEQENTYGLSARLGYVTAARDLIYVRAGVQSAAFHTTYLHSTNLSDESERRTGFGAGLGLEGAVGGRGFVRAEYLVTSWEDYDVPTGGGKFDNFSNSGGQFRMGGGLRFGPKPGSATAGVVADFAGPYVGVQAGHGALISDNEGVRSGGTIVDISRGSHGPVVGVFAGYGVKIDRFYAGIEVEAGQSAINWNIERDPNGRIYSADRGDSVAASARLGWQVSDTTLVYARAGTVRTKFEIPYATSGASVRSKETRTGQRVGAGLEVALSARARLRFDYSVTEYDRYDVAYSSNSDSFDHTEGVANIGLIWRP